MTQGIECEEENTVGPPYPFVRRIGCSDRWCPPETVKMTSNECRDDVGWRAYLMTSQRNLGHPPLDGSCLDSANGSGCKLVSAVFVETLFV
jgi:hypothetical protein